MVRTVLEAVAPARSVKHVALVTGLKHYLGPFEAYVRGGVAPPTPLREEQPRLDLPNFYYSQEDELYAAANRDGFTWSVHRPHTIIGKAIGNAMNMGSTLAAYASICKELGRPFKFPGSAAQWNGLSDMTDARVLGKQLVWASTTDIAKNEAYNIVNGDIFRWSWLWPRIAKWFGVAWEGFEGAPVPLGRPDGQRRGNLEENGDEIRSCRTRSLARGFSLAHRPRHGPADRGDDRHGAKPQTRFPCLSKYRRGFSRSLRDPARGKGHSLSPEASRWIAAAGRRTRQSRSPTPNRRRRPEGSGGSATTWPARYPMTEHELLRIIAFLERVRQPFQELVPIAEEDADLEPAAVPGEEPSDGNAGRDLHAGLGRQGSACNRNAAHPRPDRAWRHPPGNPGRGQQKVQAAPERGVARKLYSVRAQDQISARRDLWPAHQRRQRRGFLFRRLLFRGPNHSRRRASSRACFVASTRSSSCSTTTITSSRCATCGRTFATTWARARTSICESCPSCTAGWSRTPECRFPNTTSSRSTRPGSARR